MRPKEFALSMDPSDRRPMYIQVAEALITEIRKGRFLPGSPLPSTRSLAEAFGINRLTLLNAYRELESQGWITTSERSGTYVSNELPEQVNIRMAKPASKAGFDWPQQLGPLTEPGAPGLFDLREGAPDVRLFGATALGRAFRRGLQRKSKELLSPTDPLGLSRCRALLGRWLTERRGIQATPGGLLLARGPMAAVELVARAMLSPGQAIAVESPGNKRLWEALRQSGFQLVPIPVDSEGLDLNALRAELETQPIKLIYTTPFLQYPTTVGMSAARRKDLLKLAQQHRIGILEDDQELGLGFDGLPKPPLFAEDSASCVLYLGSFSRVIASGIRFAFLAGPEPFMEQVARLQSKLGWHGDPVLEYAIAELLEDGEIQRHFLKAKQALKLRRDHAAEEIQAQLGDVLSFDLPVGGNALWVRGRGGLDWGAWLNKSRKEGVLLHRPSRWSFEGSELHATRIGYSEQTQEEFSYAVEVLARGLK